MSDVADAVTQDQIADSIMSAPVVGSHQAETLAESPEEFSEAQQTAEQAAERGEDPLAPPTEQQEQPEQETLSPEELQAMLESEQPQFDQGQQEQIAPEQQFQQQPEQLPVSFEQWAPVASQFLQQHGLLNQEVAQRFATGFSQLLGNPQFFDLASGQFTPVGALAFTEFFQLHGMSYMNNLLDHYFQAPSRIEGQNKLQALIESQYEGLAEVASNAAASRAWRSVTEGDSELGKLKWGSDEFFNAMQRACEIVPNLDQMQFKDANGHLLPLQSRANMEQQFKVAARALKAGRMTPEMVKQAVSTGQRLARQSAVRRQAGNLGAGRTKGFQQRPSEDEAFWADPQSWNQYVERKL